MTMTHREAQNEMQRARVRANGRKLANNTRLFARGEGPSLEFGITLHGTEVVTIHPDGTYTLRNGGWATPTTLDRIRRYSPMTWQQLLTERGEWFIRLQPNPKDPRPERVERNIPKPYEATDPGDEPVKNPEGCVAGQIVTTEHVNETVRIFVKDVREDDIVDEDDLKKDRYDFIEVKRSWNDHVYIGENAQSYGDEGWAKFTGAERWQHRSTHTINDGEKVTYIQCSHCKEFDAIHERWHYAMHGVRYGRSFDQQTGYATYAAMMEQFGSQEAWQEAYITDFRARREYLKADREWDQRNRVPFFDGITVDSEGYAPRLREKGPSPAKLRRHEAAVAKMKKRIDKYVDGFVKELQKGTMPMPSEGDCWHCAMFDAIPPNDSATRLAKRGTTVEPVERMGSEHLLSHMEERYYVPSLAINALRERGYLDVGVYMLLDMNQDTKKMGKPHGQYDGVRRDIRRYLSKRLIPQAPQS
jgi:sarcosine oxidase delta subunit